MNGTKAPIRNRFMKIIDTCILVFLGLWIILYNYTNAFSITIIIVSIVIGVISIFEIILSIEILSLLIIDFAFIITSLKFAFTYSNLIQMISFQILILFLLEEAWFARNIVKSFTPTPEGKKMFIKMIERYYYTMALVSGITFCFSFGVIYTSLLTTVLSPNVFAVVLFTILIIISILIIQLVRVTKND